MKDDLISRQAAIEVADAVWSVTGDKNVAKVWDQIRNLPSVQERKKGRWERHYTRPNVYADLLWHCSVCGYKNENSFANVYHKFCPNCGAHMEGEEE